MKLPGIVTNVTAFGAFVDIGVHQDGLVHVSQLSDSFVRDAAEIVKVAQRVQVTVTEVDIPRKRIALSMKSKPDFEKKGGQRRPTSGGSTRSRWRWAEKLYEQRWRKSQFRRRHGQSLWWRWWWRRLVHGGGPEGEEVIQPAYCLRTCD
jgi:transcriptional accessory protein Tex/SPT6